jgi:hypothetical protein
MPHSNRLLAMGAATRLRNSVRICGSFRSIWMRVRRMPGRYTTRSVHDHPRSVQIGGVMPRKAFTELFSCRGRRYDGPGALSGLWPRLAGEAAGPFVVR